MMGDQDPRLASALAVASDKHARGRRLKKIEKTLPCGEAHGGQGRAVIGIVSAHPHVLCARACPRLVSPHLLTWSWKWVNCLRSQYTSGCGSVSKSSAMLACCVVWGAGGWWVSGM